MPVGNSKRETRNSKPKGTRNAKQGREISANLRRVVRNFVKINHKPTRKTKAVQSVLKSVSGNIKTRAEIESRRGADLAALEVLTGTMQAIGAELAAIREIMERAHPNLCAENIEQLITVTTSLRNAISSGATLAEWAAKVPAIFHRPAHQSASLPASPSEATPPSADRPAADCGAIPSPELQQQAGSNESPATAPLTPVLSSKAPSETAGAASHAAAPAEPEVYHDASSANGRPASACAVQPAAQPGGENCPICGSLLIERDDRYRECSSGGCHYNLPPERGGE